MGTASVTWLDQDPGYLGLGTTPVERRAQYAQWVAEGIPAGEWEVIRSAIQRGHLTGDAQFVDTIADGPSCRDAQADRGNRKINLSPINLSKWYS